MTVCRLGEILAKAEPAETLALSTAINEQGQSGNYVWSAKSLSKAINKTRFSVGSTTIKEHRRKTCGCYA